MVHCPDLASPLAPAPTKPVEIVSVAQFSFLANTRITTLRGDIPVSELTTSDRVRVRTGEYAPVRRIDCRTLAVRQLENGPKGTISLRRNTLGEGLPRRDMALTNGHMIEGRLSRHVAHLARLVPGLPGLTAEGTVELVVFDCVGATSVRAEGLWVRAIMRTCIVDEGDAPVSSLIRVHA